MTKDIIKKESLKDIKIVGGVLVSRAGDTLNLTIENLLQWCDWILIMLDNADLNTLKIVDQLKLRYPNRIRVEYSGFERLPKEDEGKPRKLLQRFKGLQGPIRETVFEYMRKENLKEKIDILVYPDSDEIFGNYFEKLLLEFWNADEMKAIKMRCVWPFGDLKTIGVTKMCSHVRVFKFTPLITTDPWRHDWLRNPTPFTRKEFLIDRNTLIHISHFIDSMIKWRTTEWRNFPSLEIPLWTLDKDVRETSSEEIINKLKTTPDLTIGEYIKKHGKNYTN